MTDTFAPPITTTDLAKLSEAALAYAGGARARNTERAYEADWRDWLRFAEAHDLSALPADPAHLALYAASLADRVAVSTIRRRLTGIGNVHRRSDHADPTRDKAVTSVLAGIRRRHGRPATRPKPLTADHLADIVAALGDDPASKRDKALLLMGFCGLLRRSELTSLHYEDIDTASGLDITVTRSKTDPHGTGRRIHIGAASDPTLDPKKAVIDWLETRGRHPGPLFSRIHRPATIGTKPLTGKSVTNILHKRLADAGLDPAGYSAHSLRSGGATALAKAGLGVHEIADRGGWSSIETLRHYLHSTSDSAKHTALLGL